jgi:hypothetical protein
MNVYRDERFIFSDVSAAIDAFYTNLAVKYPGEAEVRLKVIRNFSVTANDDLIGRLQTALRLKERSRVTIASYTAAVRKYLDYIRCAPSADDREKIESYVLQLRNIGRLAPRTVNLTSAALSFFYANIMHAGETVDSLPRMKPGMSLPKVYGQ